VVEPWRIDNDVVSLLRDSVQDIAQASRDLLSNASSRGVGPRVLDRQLVDVDRGHPCSCLGSEDTQVSGSAAKVNHMSSGNAREERSMELDHGRGDTRIHGELESIDRISPVAT
jgi:hypothetical protein